MTERKKEMTEGREAAQNNSLSRKLSNIWKTGVRSQIFVELPAYTLQNHHNFLE